MDYSTISNKTATFSEVDALTNGEWSERYYLLKKQFESVSISYETTKQELHDTRRSYQTALDVQSHLSAELEGYQAEEVRRRNELNSRITTLQEDISSLRQERAETAERHSNEVKQLEARIGKLKDELSTKVERVSPERDNSELDEVRASLNEALSEAVSAKAALEEARVEMGSWRMRAEELVNEMAEMRAVAELRKEELNSVGEREAVALADLAEARALLNQCTNSQDLEPHAAKGNSIFAEVEDKRQEMAKNLIQMKQTNSRLRRDLANKQAELETLLHEKQTIWEQQSGAAAHYDKELIDSYQERITQLEGVCERQRRELTRWFARAPDAAAGWLPAVLGHLKSEVEDLRGEVLSRGAAQLAAAAQVRELRRKIALLTAGSPPTTDGALTHTLQVVKDDIPVKVTPKMRPVRSTPDEAKKRVQFN